MVSMYLILLILLLMLLFGLLPQLSGQWHHAGYGPSGLAFVILLIMLLLVVLGRL